MRPPVYDWPEGRTFAFTIFDDTDHATLDNVPHVYGLLDELGMRTTKSVWPVRGDEVPEIGGSTCEDEPYRSWLLALQERGFEIALHNATYHSSTRPKVLAALDRFRELFGHDPSIQVNHAGYADSIHWGPERVTGLQRFAYDLLTRGRKRYLTGGTDEASPHFWGDACEERVRYVRNFVFSDINTLRACPQLPYHDPARPYVRQWFASSEGPDCTSFKKTIAEEHQDRLEEEGGACIMYTHFGAADFMPEGRLDREFVRLLTRLADKGGWYVPVSTLLDEIRRQRGEHVITSSERRRLERRWLLEKVFVTRGTS